MSKAEAINWKRLAAEAVAIVGSILLAFAIDAWWADRSEQRHEVESLELLEHELIESRTQLEDYANYAALASQAALNAYVALSGPGPYDRDRIRAELFRVDRRTLRIPTAAYTELLSTGNLRVIEDRELRNSIVRFYEAVELTELVIQKNNDAFLDGILIDSYYRTGMLVPYPTSVTGLDAVDESVKRMQERMPEGFARPEDPMWKFGPDSPEWRNLRSALLISAQIHGIGEARVLRIIDHANRLSARVSATLSDI